MTSPAWLIRRIAASVAIAGLAGLTGAGLQPVLAAELKPFHITQNEGNLQTLGELKPSYIDFSSKPMPRVSLVEVIRRYIELIKTSNDAQFRVDALHRLANLEALLGDQDVEEFRDAGLWQIAIDSYTELLRGNPRREGYDQMLYQLAHAHEMRGELEASLKRLQELVARAPQSPYVPEAQFRIAELQYSFGRYGEAQKSYEQVLKQGQQGFASQAQYMLGWALFKQSRYQAALTQYLSVLDELSASQVELSSVDQELQDDTLRIMAVILAHNQGPKTLAELLNQAQRHQYAELLYERLMAHYMALLRYQDAAATADAFITHYPYHPQAARFSVRRIDALEMREAPMLVWQEKERFVDAFGTQSDYWGRQTHETRSEVLPYLKIYLDELGRLYYSRAQEGRGAANYQHAARYFSQYVETFPRAEASAEKYFLLGEALNNTGRFEPAIRAYEQAAYQFPDFAKRNEAAYAAVLAYERLIQNAPDKSQAVWRQRRLAALIRFADTFPEDSRVASLLLLATNEHLALGNYKATLETSRRIINSPSQESQASLRGAYLAHGHAAFELGFYNEAEASFKEALARWQGQSQLRAEIEEKLAVSVYKQGELLLAQNHILAAAEQMLRVGDVAPQSDIRARAHYDAAMKLLEAKIWPQAIEVLVTFRNQFPRHELAEGIQENLIYAYEQNRQPEMAAKELLAIYKSDPVPERRRKALLQAAELFEHAGMAKDAMAAYENYVKQFPQPVEQVAEVHRKLVDIYTERRESAQRKRALNALVGLEKTAGKAGSERLRYLAAEASWLLAEDLKKEFDAIRLTLPLDRALAKKQKAMEQTMAMLKRSNDYGVSEFSTAATHLSGEVYHQLSQDLIRSARPEGLSELELEQYELLLEEQAFPFEERAIEFYELNTARAKQGIYDRWVQQSYRALSKLVPARYEKDEIRVHVVSKLR